MAVDISAGLSMDTYSQIGKAEDVDSLISNVTPTETPYLSSLGSQKVSARNPEWQEDSIRAAAQNQKVEGAEYAVVDRDPTVMRENYTQILADAFMVSATADTIKTHGRARETAYQLVKTGKALKLDLEFALIGQVQNASVATASTARVMGNILGQDASTNAMASNSFDVQSTVSGVGDGTAAFAEGDVIHAMELAYNAGVPGKVLMIPPGYAKTIGAFSSASGAYTAGRDLGDSKTLVMAIEILVTPYGTCKVVLNRQMEANTGLLYDPSYHKLGKLRGWKKEPLAKTGDNEKYGMVGEFTFIHRNYNESVILTNMP